MLHGMMDHENAQSISHDGTKNNEGNINIDTTVSALYKASGWP
jgi:hypothetical protein